MWVGRTDPQAGDIATFNWDGGEPDHIGIVQQNLGNGVFTTIEGKYLDRQQFERRRRDATFPAHPSSRRFRTGKGEGKGESMRRAMAVLLGFRSPK